MEKIEIQINIKTQSLAHRACAKHATYWDEMPDKNWSGLCYNCHHCGGIFYFGLDHDTREVRKFSK